MLICDLLFFLKKGVRRMKRFIEGGFLAIITFCLFTGIINAKSGYYTNEVGVEMTELEYNKMLKIYSDRYVSYMSQELFDSLKDCNIISNEVVYHKSLYDRDGKLIDEEYISEEEYNEAPSSNASSAINPISSESDYVETSYKKLMGVVTEIASRRYAMIGSLSWKKVPATRSYDVFAYRFNHLSYKGFAGEQAYYKSGTFNRIAYDTSSPGYKYFDNGAGVSMNLVDGSDVTGYELSVVTDLTANAPSNIVQGHVYITYQHAQSNLSREDSKNYVLSAGGLGNVLLFNSSSIGKKYDAMGGLHMIPTF